MRKPILILGLLFLAVAVKAQDKSSNLSQKEIKRLQKYQTYREQQGSDLIYDHELNVGGRLNTDGWSGFLEYGKRTSDLTTTLLQLELGEKKHPKEDKQSYVDPYTGFSTKPFIYGKQNIFYQVKLGIGQRYLIGGKGNKNGVEVSAVYLGGVSLGLLRPYYLQVNGGSGTEYIKYSDDTREEFLNLNDIISGSGLSKGWDELQVAPGLHAQLGMRFDWAQFNEVVSALEVGINAEAYSKKIPIMIDNKEQQFFFNAYVTLLFGKRW